MGDTASFCLFHSHSLPYAVAVESVAEIVEIESLVRMTLCPPQVVGLCPCRREVVPVVALGQDSSRVDVVSAEKWAPEQSTQQAVLMLRTDQGVWGIQIEREGTAITPEQPVMHEPQAGEDGVVTIGMLHHRETEHALLDAEKTWRGLRDVIARWYGGIIESQNSSYVPD